MEIKRVFLFLILVFGLFPQVLGDTAYLQLDRNEYYETCEVAYNMEDYVNTTHLYDFALNGYHGHETGLSSVSGVYGQGLTGFDAVNGYNVTVPNLNILSVPYTIMMWVYPSLDPNMDYLFFGNTSAGLNGVDFDISDNVSFSCGLDTVTSNQEIQNNVWTHIACVSEPSNTTHEGRIYYNGSLVSGPVGLWRLRDWDSRACIGDNDDALNRYSFHGIIDEFRIYEGEARTQAEILEDMVTPTAMQLTIEGLEPNTDVIQLWYENETLFEQQTADSNGQVEFNVYEFSEHNSTYTGVINVYHEDIQYEGYIMVLNWGDILEFVVLGIFADLFTQLFWGTGTWFGLLIMLSIMFLVSLKIKYTSILFIPICLFMGVLYLQNVAPDNSFMWAGLLMFFAMPFLLLIEVQRK